MKKIYLVASLLLGSFVVTAQDAAVTYRKGLLQEPTTHNQFEKKSLTNGETVVSKKHSTNNAATSQIWFNDFSNPADWVISNTTGDASNWTISANDTSLIGGWRLFLTIGNYAMFDPWAHLDTINGKYHRADLTNAAPINCAGYNAVVLKFIQNTGNIFCNNSGTINGDSTVVYVSNDSINWTAFPVNEEVACGYYSGANPDIYELNISSVATNEDSVWVRFHYYGDSAQMKTYAFGGAPWQIDDIELYEPDPTDAICAGVVLNQNGCTLSSTETVTAYVYNNGYTDLTTFNMYYSVNGGTPVNETVSGVNIAFDSLFKYDFTTKADFSGIGTYTVVAWVVATGDALLDNDTNGAATESFMPFTFSSPGPGNPFEMGFEATDDLSTWSLLDANDDGVQWAVINTFSRTGTNCLRKAGSGSADNDWLWTGCISLNAGTPYYLEYWHKNFDDSAVCSLRSKIGLAQDTVSMTQLISNDAVPVPNDTMYHLSTTTFTVPTSGSYFIAWQAYSAAGSASIRLDDIYLDIATGINDRTLENGVNIYPNPSRGMINLENKTQAEIAVSVYNSLGQVVFTKNYNRLIKTEIDLSNQADGVYSVQVRSNDSVINKSVVISH